MRRKGKEGRKGASVSLPVTLLFFLYNRASCSIIRQIKATNHSLPLIPEVVGFPCVKKARNPAFRGRCEDDKKEEISSLVDDPFLTRLLAFFALFIVDIAIAGGIWLVR